MSTASSDGSRLPASINRLALKIASPVTVVATLAGGLLSAWPLSGAILMGLGLGAVAYTAAHLCLHRRLRRMHSTLQHIRRHEFDEVTSPSPSHSDELSVLTREIYRTGQKLETEIQELKERESYRREFIGNVSHELKTPIFSAQGFAETLLDGALEDEEVNRTFLEKILHNVSRLENLARDLSAITEIETGEMEMSHESFSLDEVFQDVCGSLELKARKHEIALCSEVADDLPAVYGDRDRIRRVLVNLTDNAIKYNEPGGTVTLRAQPRPTDEVDVSVEDDGIGIPSEHLPRLTERFYRVDKSRSRNQGGTGLGLAIVKHVLGAHDRDLHVESTPGEGSTFHFCLSTTPLRSLESS